ncbi:hypothetical protein BAE44_0018330 [Dichanthelium oligosanthes]|uniref:Protein N-lysine methyltransferase METTL21A n=1 Tax=Dichanthelium oligosanthes TaxID=888268 RepID=A0A1E5V662_9POAL|nr:hypothetical protein BAE44_0018330 [Dichanthelium oligosanthes]
MADSGSPRKREEEEEEDDIVCLDPSFFVDRSYEMTTFTFGSHELRLLCLRAASTDYDLTGQLVWPGAVLMNNYLSEHPETVKECSVIELGSGIGITGILCSRFCKNVVLTDHNDEVLEARKRVPSSFMSIQDIQNVLYKGSHYKSSWEEIVELSLFFHMDVLILKEAEKRGMCVKEVDGTRTTISNLEGVIFDITLK